MATATCDQFQLVLQGLNGERLVEPLLTHERVAVWRDVDLNNVAVGFNVRHFDEIFDFSKSFSQKAWSLEYSIFVIVYINILVCSYWKNGLDSKVRLKRQIYVYIFWFIWHRKANLKQKHDLWVGSKKVQS